MSVKVPKYNPEEPCSKCGTGGPALKLVFVVAVPPPRPRDIVPIEVLEATCWKCGAQWMRLPMDAKIPKDDGESHE